MDFDKVVGKRVSVTSFTSKRPSWKDAMLAVDAALQGPFAGNKNNLKFIIVEHPEIIKQLAKHASQSWIAAAKMAIVICSDDTILEEMYGERGRVYSRQQAGAAISTVLLKLVDQGLAGCWVGAYTDEIIRQILKIPGHMQVEAIIPVGYAAPKQKKKRKLALSSSVKWESFEGDRRPTALEEPEVKYLGHNDF
jgi:nitroreductase